VSFKAEEDYIVSCFFYFLFFLYTGYTPEEFWDWLWLWLLCQGWETFPLHLR